MRQNQDLLNIARLAATRAAQSIREAVRPADPAVWDTKGAKDFATAVDRESERLIAELLLDAVPESSVLGEELSPTMREAEVLWVVDPLDGTTNYLHDYPVYAVSIGAVVRGEIVAGTIVDVTRSRVYGAALGGGAWCGDRRLEVSRIARPEHALIGTGFPFREPAAQLLPQYLHQLQAVITSAGGVRRAGAAALDLADVAQGRLDAYWEYGLSPWDVAAGILLIREAGGIVTEPDGTPAGFRSGHLVAGNAALHPWLRGTLERP